MNRLQTFLFLPLVIAWISGSVIELIARPGDNITIYCDCKTTTEELIRWYRNCSHENQPRLVLQLKEDLWKPKHISVNTIPHFHFVKNQTSKSYDLLIQNISDSEVGLYYCGTEEKKLEEKTKVQLKYVYTYGKVKTRILIEYNETHCPNSAHHDDTCWMLLFTLCPAFALVSALLFSLLVYQLCQKTAKDSQTDIRRPTEINQENDVCYAAVEIRNPKTRPKKKKPQRFDSSIYSVVNTCRV